MKEVCLGFLRLNESERLFFAVQDEQRLIILPARWAAYSGWQQVKGKAGHWISYRLTDMRQTSSSPLGIQLESDHKNRLYVKPDVKFLLFHLPMTRNYKRLTFFLIDLICTWCDNVKHSVVEDDDDDDDVMGGRCFPFSNIWHKFTSAQLQTISRTSTAPFPAFFQNEPPNLPMWWIRWELSSLLTIDI